MGSVLLGRLNTKSGEYKVQTLLIPRQVSDENSCTMTEEEMVIEFQEKRDLVTLGWVSYLPGMIHPLLIVPSWQIHTHPTQSCALSFSAL